MASVQKLTTNVLQYIKYNIIPLEAEFTTKCVAVWKVCDTGLVLLGENFLWKLSIVVIQ
jgi:hypothetical protein